ncbi:MAG: class I SAM-dependent methyltransferase [Solirubrobacteraceae bacterium]
MHPFFGLPVVSADRWQMQQGERFALDGLLSQLRPRLAIEVGTFEGGSLRRIAAHAEHVHAFDLDPKVAALADELDNVSFHIGDSTELLPRLLADLGREGGHVDFALIDGAHTREAVRGDGAALLAAEACRQTVIVFHDSANVAVRAGLEDLDLPDHPKVALALLDCVPGYLVQAHDDHELVGQAFNGLALVVLDAGRDPDARAPDASEFVPVPALHEAYAAAQQPHEAFSRKAGAVGSAAAVSALLGVAAGAAAGAVIASRRR